VTEPEKVAHALNGAAEKLQTQADRQQWLTRILYLLVFVGLIIIIAMAYVIRQLDESVDQNIQNQEEIQASIDRIELFVDEVREGLKVFCDANPEGALCLQEEGTG